MEAAISILLEVSDEEVLADVVQHLELMLPYMADNVFVKSGVIEPPIVPLTREQRAALFASFTEVFGHSENEARYAFTRMVIGLGTDEVVSWSSHRSGAISSPEASKVLDALNLLNV